MLNVSNGNYLCDIIVLSSHTAVISTENSAPPVIPGHGLKVYEIPIMLILKRCRYGCSSCKGDCLETLSATLISLLEEGPSSPRLCC